MNIEIGRMVTNVRVSGTITSGVPDIETRNGRTMRPDSFEVAFTVKDGAWRWSALDLHGAVLNQDDKPGRNRGRATFHNFRATQLPDGADEIIAAATPTQPVPAPTPAPECPASGDTVCRWHAPHAWQSLGQEPDPTPDPGPWQPGETIACRACGAQVEVAHHVTSRRETGTQYVGRLAQH